MNTKKILAMFLVFLMLSGMVTGVAAEAVQSDIKIMVNGKYLQNIDVLQKDGRALVPSNEILESLGAKVNYEKATGNVQAELNGRKITLKPNDGTIHIDSNGTSSQITMDVLPVIMNGTTYVPVRFLSEALGLSASWDSINRAAVILDFEGGLLNGIDANYTVFNRLLRLNADPSKTYQVTSTSKTVGVTSDNSTGVSKKMTQAMDSKVDMFSRGSDMNMVCNISMDMAYEGFTDEEIAATAPMLELMRDMTITVLYDSKNECLYANLGSLGALLTGSTDENMWFSLDLTSFIDETSYAADIRKLASGDYTGLTFGTLLNMCLNHPDMYNADSYDAMKFVLDLTSELLSDKAFTIGGTAEKPEYSYSLDTAKIQKAFVTAGTKSVASMKEATDMINTMDLAQIVDFEMNVKIIVNSNHDFKITGDYKMNFDAMAASEVLGTPIDGMANMKYSMTMKFDQSFPGTSEATADVAMKMDGVDVTSTSSASAETKTVDMAFATTPPAGANIVDVMEMITGLMSELR